MSTDQRLFREIAILCAPPRKLTVSEWADQNRVLSRKSSARSGRWKTRPYQREPMDEFTNPAVHTIVLMVAIQSLKCLSVDTPIPVPGGWKLLGDIRVGDQVFDDCGHPCTVVSTSEMFDGRPCYRIGFDDGHSIISDGSHRWPVFRGGGHDRSAASIPETIATTEEIGAGCSLRKTNGGKAWRYRIRCAGALQLPDADLPIDPYVLGAWLGDGHSACAQITCDSRDGVLDQLRATGVQTQIVSRDARRPHVLTVQVGTPSKLSSRTHCRRGHELTAANRGKRGCRKCAVLHSQSYQCGFKIPSVKTVDASDSMTAQLRRIGVLQNKHVPEVYFRASEAQRRALIQGLLDTDGTARNSGVVFTVTSRQLAHDCRDLAITLGFKPTVRERRARCNGKDCGPCYTVLFTAYKEDQPFRLKRKMAALRSWADPKALRTESRRRSVVSVEPVEPVTVKCITVDSFSHLYLAGPNMVPTHNTESMLNCLGYLIDQDPGPTLLVHARDTDCQKYSKIRLTPMIQETPCLAAKVADIKSRVSDNTIDYKEFPGGHLSIVASGSPGNLAALPIRYLFCDEIDKYPASAGSAGDPISLAQGRQEEFWNRKTVLACTPTIQGQSRIEKAFLDSDQRKYEIPCPNCGHFQIPDFRKHVRVNHELPRHEQPKSALYHCEECDTGLGDVERWKAIKRGRYRATALFNGIAGFWMSGLCRLGTKLSDLFNQFLSKKDNVETLKQFVNEQLAELWTEPGETLEWERLVDRREDYPVGIVPKCGLFLTCGVDVQRADGGRLEAEIVAFGENRETWSVDYRIFYGDPARPEVWTKLEDLLHETFPHESGGELSIERMFVDSGDGTTTREVYEWVQKQPRPQVWAIKGDTRGRDQAVGPPRSVESKKGKYGAILRIINVNFFKPVLYADLRKRKPTDEELKAGLSFPQGYCHLPKDAEKYSDEHFKQICAERLVNHRMRSGGTKPEWRKEGRNEALDARIYAMAASWEYGAHRFQPRHWEMLRKRLTDQTKKLTAPEAPGAVVVAQQQPRDRIVRSQFMDF